jgi:lysophospholipase L1-like esterase
MDKRKIFRMVGLVIVCVAVVILDFLVGFFNDTKIYRDVTYSFRSEVSSLNTTTNHLVPKLRDVYPIEDGYQETPRLVRTDDYGLIIGPAGVSNEKGSTRILFLGGSTTENNEVDEAYRFPYLSAKMLSGKMNRQYYGVNAGVRGHTTQNSLNLYLNHPSPDITEAKYVVVMHNINDRLRLAIFNSYKSTLSDKSPVTLDYSLNQFDSFLESLWFWSSFHSNILYLVDTVYDKFIGGLNGSTGIVNERTLDKNFIVGDNHLGLYKKNLKTLVSVIKANEAVPIFMTQPLGRDSLGQDKFNEVMRSVASNEKIELIDLANEIKIDKAPDTLFFPDGIHFNNKGSMLASSFIAAHLKKLVSKN